MKSGFRNCVIKSVGTSVGYHLDEESDLKLRGTPEHVVSSGMLREFLKCPSRWRNGYVFKGSDATLFGGMVDCLLRTPDELEDKYPLKPPLYEDKKGNMVWSPTSTVCKEWTAMAKAAGREPIDQENLDEAMAAIKRMKDDPYIAPWLESCSHQVWLTGEWCDEDTGLTIPVKALLDDVPRLDSPHYRCLGDGKCIRNALLDPFIRQIHSNGWHIQAAFYEDFYIAATKGKEDRNTWIFTGVENYKPFEPYRRLLPEEFKEIGRRAYRSGLRQYAKALKTGHWRGYDDLPKDDPLTAGGFTICYPLPYMDFTEQSNIAQEEYESQVTRGESDEDSPPM